MISELENYSQRIEDLCRQIVDLISDLPADALNWRPLEDDGQDSVNSLAVLAAHVAGAEHFWIAEVVGQRPPTRDRDAEFQIQVTGAAELVQRLEEVGAETAQVLAGLKADDLSSTRQVRGRTVTVRWGILHIIDHTSLHLGHMQITYQLWRGGQVKPSPFWYERLPSE